jgi:hypothetical protein
MTKLIKSLVRNFYKFKSEMYISIWSKGLEPKNNIRGS